MTLLIEPLAVGPNRQAPRVRRSWGALGVWC
jgi:hypothetical protein